MSKKKNEVVKRDENKIMRLIIDLETAPHEVYAWTLWDVNVSIGQIIKPSSIICWAAKWVGEDHTYFSSIEMTDRKSMLQAIWDMMDQAHEIIGWNSNSFDIKLLNAEFIEHGMTPPSPYKKVDLMRVVKSNMKFASHKLDYVSQKLGIGKKVEHEGFPLWVSCIKNLGKNKTKEGKLAWQKMTSYNIGDVELTEKMYYKVLPWISTGVNSGSFHVGQVCPNCESKKLHSRGLYRTTTSVYQRFQCQDCGHWSRGEKLSDQKPELRSIR